MARTRTSEEKFLCYNDLVSQEQRRTKRIRKYATGEQEALLLREMERRGLPVFSVPEHTRTLSRLQPAQIRNTLHRLVGKGAVIPIERGRYLVLPRAARHRWSEQPYVLAQGIAPSPSYVSFWSALAYHELTTQLPRVVYMATDGVRKRPVAFQGWHFRFVPLSPAKFYGSSVHEFPALNGAATVEVSIATPAKAIVDSLDGQLLAGGFTEIVGAVRRGLEAGKLPAEEVAVTTARFPNRSVVARLGYILDRLGADEHAALLRPRVRTHGEPPRLSSTWPSGGPVNTRWHLRINIPGDFFDEDVTG